MKPPIFRREEMITVAEFAKRLGISRRHAYNLVEKGRSDGGVIAFRFGAKRGLRIPVSEVERFRRERRIDELNHGCAV